jgi:hypothetical protein
MEPKRAERGGREEVGGGRQGFGEKFGGDERGIGGGECEK